MVFQNALNHENPMTTSEDTLVLLIVSIKICAAKIILPGKGIICLAAWLFG